MNPENVAAPEAPVVQEQVSEPVKEAVTETAPEKPVDRRDAIRQAVEQKTESRPENQDAHKDSKPRDEKGKFAQSKVDNPAIIPKKERKYPSDFKPEYKTAYEKLVANEEFHGILDEIDRRGQEYFKGIEPYKESAAFAQSVKKAIQPYENNLRALNLTPDKAVEALLRADNNLRTLPMPQRQAYLRQLASQYGIDLSGGNEEQPQHQPDPLILSMAQRQEALERRIQEQDMERANQQAESFGKDKPYFKEAREKMGDLLEFYTNKGIAKTLDELYDEAIYTLPDIRAKVEEKKFSELQNKRQEEAKKSVNKAKSANVQIKGAPSSGASVIRPVTGKSRRDVIADAVNRA